MIRPVLTYPDPILAKTAAEIETITPEIRQLAEDMLETMYHKEGLGLAAPQVGESCRLIVVDVTGPDKREEPLVFVNPRIVEAQGQVESSEGCLSVMNYRSKVQRAERVRLQALNLDGQPVEVEVDGMLAICLQHELDHLDGVLFIDKISRLKRSLYEQKLKKWLKKH
ncbi:peptide deformylase [Desulfonatronum sp. SC1]|uniref:peptide deformylase n=1 Tax=Desulfonatronum sp. SC1 TaxID=2109626 RepID=UPI000D327E74|nr:peptide deformylase [Desulfonatronum sp. SC1]PTN38222.1 peptide deformylase [Desulfonatronum sp. SC1]